MPRIFLLFLALLIAFAVFIALRSNETAASSANEIGSVVGERILRSVNFNFGGKCASFVSRPR